MSKQENLESKETKKTPKSEKTQGEKTEKSVDTDISEDTAAEATIETLKKTLAEANEKAQKNWDLYLRATAEADNSRRRSRIDVENAHKYSLERFAKELLTVVDSLERGLAVTNEKNTEHAQLEAIIEGITLTQKLFLDVLGKFGIEPIDPQGALFDPKSHEALTARPNSEVPPKTVLEVVQKGYRQHDRILRPAQVVVSK